uniref:Uncharacterized protein n=1 Tax=Glossina palpalis gambiensis TaxID=67801 RepID=A0A1B0B5L6_9MUSC
SVERRDSQEGRKNPKRYKRYKPFNGTVISYKWKENLIVRSRLLRKGEEQILDLVDYHVKLIVGLHSTNLKMKEIEIPDTM